MRKIHHLSEYIRMLQADRTKIHHIVKNVAESLFWATFKKQVMLLGLQLQVYVDN